MAKEIKNIQDLIAAKLQELGMKPPKKEPAADKKE